MSSYSNLTDIDFFWCPFMTSNLIFLAKLKGLSLLSEQKCGHNFNRLAVLFFFQVNHNYDSDN